MHLVIHKKGSIVREEPKQKNTESCKLVAERIVRENPRHTHCNKTMWRTLDDRQKRMLCGARVTCDWLEMMMVRMSVFVQINRCSDMKDPVEPKEDSITYDHIHGE